MPENDAKNEAKNDHDIFQDDIPTASSPEDSSPSLILPAVVLLEDVSTARVAEKSEKNAGEKYPRDSVFHASWRQAAHSAAGHGHPLEILLRFFQKQFSLPMLYFLESAVVNIGHFAVISGAFLMPIYCYYGVRNPASALAENPNSAGSGSLGVILGVTLMLLAFQYITWRLVRDFKTWNLESPGKLCSRSICDITSAFFFLLGLGSLMTFTLNGLYYKEYFLLFFGLCLCFGCLYIAFYALHPALSAIRYAPKNPPEEEIYGVCIFLAKLIFMRGAFMFYGLVSLIVVALATYFFFMPQNIFRITFFAQHPFTPHFFALCLLVTAVAPIIGCVLYLSTTYIFMALRSLAARPPRDK